MTIYICRCCASLACRESIFSEVSISNTHGHCHGQSSLMAASHGGHVDMVQMLLESDAHACRFTRYQAKIFFDDCSKNNHVDVVKMLLDGSIYRIVMDSPL